MKKRFHPEEQDFELNIASIIDCFTVLITFMLASASFLSIGMLDAGVAAAGPGSSETKQEPPPISITIELLRDSQMRIKLAGKEKSVIPISPLASARDVASATTATSGKEWNYDLLASRLKEIKARWPQVNSVTLEAENAIEYKDVVRTMEQIRKTQFLVLLGGF